MPLDDILSGADIADAFVAGWRYLLSRDYRLKKRREWRECGWLMMLVEIVFGVLGVLLSLAVVGLIIFVIRKS